MSRALIAGVMAAAAIATCLQLPTAQAQERDLKFVLDFISLGRHAPWYVALGKGYFKDEGLNVTIMPSKGTADAIRTVATGGADIGFIDIPSLVASGSAGASVKIVAANYQKPPYCIFTLNPGANVTEPKQMAGLELGSSTASFVPKIWAAFMEMNKVDSKTLKVLNIDAASRVPMLAAGKVQSIDQFLMSEPAIRRAVTSAKPVCLFAGDYGLEIYANSIGVSDDFLTKNPDVVKKFVRAALKGWKDALADPEEAARIEIQFVKALDPQIVVEEIQILKRIAALANGDIAAALVSVPRAFQAKQAGFNVLLRTGDYLPRAGGAFWCTDDYFKKNPETVKKFVRAALRGWKDTFANPQEASQIQLQYVKALDPQIIVEEIDILRRVAITPEVQKSGLGLVTAERMKNTVDFINKNIEVPGEKVTAEQIFVPGFLPERPILP